ncbi:hypothetical protein FHX69_3325 [Prauserella muralis]|nr:hypothetical protein FHX69_3325 [Prauserella muralis]
MSRGLAGYVHAVARAVGVPAEATSFEVSDTATAYLGLTRRWIARPGHDLMLVWNEQHGWAVAVETDPGEPPQVMGYLAGAGVVPEPDAVARFVSDVIAGRARASPEPGSVLTARRHELAERLARYVQGA